MPDINPSDPACEVPLFSVVVPCFNEGAGVAAFHRRLAAVMQALGRGR